MYVIASYGDQTHTVEGTYLVDTHDVTLQRRGRRQRMAHS